VLLASGVAVVVAQVPAMPYAVVLCRQDSQNLTPRLPQVHDVTPHFPIPIGFAGTANANPTPVSFAFATVKARESSG
jgi:hypothetical protein